MTANEQTLNAKKATIMQVSSHCLTFPLPGRFRTLPPTENVRRRAHIKKTVQPLGLYRLI